MWAWSVGSGTSDVHRQRVQRHELAGRARHHLRTAVGDRAEDDGEVPLRVRGHSKDHRGDLPQVVIGMAVTRGGIPVRLWVWPGNTSDLSVVEQVKSDPAGWQLNRLVWITDSGFNSADNR
jgi:transposase